MKKNLFLMFALLFTFVGCSKHEIGKKKPTVGATVSLDKKELTLTSGESYQFKVTYTGLDTTECFGEWTVANFKSNFSEYTPKPKITRGFISPEESGTFDVIFTLMTKEGDIIEDTCKVTCLVSKKEIHRLFCYNYAVEDTTGILSGEMTIFNPLIYQENDTTYLVGFKKDKIWIGTFNKQTKEQIDEWIDTEPTSKIQKIHVSYGNYKEFTINNGYVKSFIRDGDDIILNLSLINDRESDTYWHTMLCFRKEGKTKKYFYKDSRFRPIQNWHENSYLLNIDVSQEPYYTDDNVYTCFSDKGDVILSGKLSYRLDKTWFPTSFDEFIYIDQPYGKKLFIYKWSISKDKTIWSKDLGYDVENNVQYTSSIAKKNGNIWTFNTRIIPISGREYTLIYDVNISDGTIVKLNN